MFPDRVIPAREANLRQIDSFPYFAASFSSFPSQEQDGDDQSIGSGLTTPEEDARRLVSVDQLIFEKMQKADSDAHDIARRAYEEGFASGEREGREFGESQYRVYIQRLDAHMKELSRMASILEKATEDEILALSFTMAEYLAAQQLDRSFLSVKPLMESVLSSHPFPTSGSEGATDIVLTAYLNPRDLDDLGDTYIGYPGLRLAEDSSLTRGSLRLESPDGVFEATLERRREHLADLLSRLREADNP